MYHIMVWNIRFGDGRRVPDILEVIARHLPDVVVLPERVRRIFYSHDERYAGISDHSSLHLVVDLPENPGGKKPYRRIRRAIDASGS